MLMVQDESLDLQLVGNEQNMYLSRNCFSTIILISKTIVYHMTVTLHFPTQDSQYTLPVTHGSLLEGEGYLWFSNCDVNRQLILC